jgi:hypothetical protein
VHHPSSKVQEEIIQLDDYLERSKDTIQAAEGIEWWQPFLTAADFTFAEWVSDAQLSNAKVDSLLQKLRGEWSDQSKVTFRSHRDIESIMERAKFETTTVSEYTYLSISKFGY